MESRLVWDGTEADMARLVAENSTLVLVEVQNHFDGNFLVFSDKFFNDKLVAFLDDILLSACFNNSKCHM